MIFHTCLCKLSVSTVSEDIESWKCGSWIWYPENSSMVLVVGSSFWEKITTKLETKQRQRTRVEILRAILFSVFLFFCFPILASIFGEWMFKNVSWAGNLWELCQFCTVVLSFTTKRILTEIYFTIYQSYHKGEKIP